LRTGLIGLVARIKLVLSFSHGEGFIKLMMKTFGAAISNCKYCEYYVFTPIKKTVASSHFAMAELVFTTYVIV